eukprot:15437076-Alexandrium_andersonii.AAC.1
MPSEAHLRPWLGWSGLAKPATMGEVRVDITGRLAPMPQSSSLLMPSFPGKPASSLTARRPIGGGSDGSQ